MKKILLSMSIISLCASVASAQGLVFFTTGPSPVTRISTNSILGGPATGYAGNAPGTGGAFEGYFSRDKLLLSRQYYQTGVELRKLAYPRG